MFDYIETELSDASIFANKICSLLISEHNGDIDAALKDFHLINKGLHRYIPNISDLIDTEIPLMGLHGLLLSTPSKWLYNEEEYNAAIERTYNACMAMYCVNQTLPTIPKVSHNIANLSIVKWIGSKVNSEFNYNDSYIFHGEIPNMRGHCVVSHMKTGKLYSGYHIIDFKVVDDD